MTDVIVPRRIYHGDFGGGACGVHMYRNELIGVGASTTRHCHQFDHITMPLPIWNGQRAKFMVEAFYPDGRKIDLPLDDDWPMIVIEAGVDHRVTLLEGDRGFFMCIWSHYQKIGDQVYHFADPKVSPQAIKTIKASGHIV